MAYSEKVVEHYENPRNVGSFEKGDDTVGTGMVGAPACGDVMKLQHNLASSLDFRLYLTYYNKGAHVQSDIE